MMFSNLYAPHITHKIGIGGHACTMCMQVSFAETPLRRTVNSRGRPTASVSATSTPASAMLCIRSVLLALVSAQFGSISIDWSVDASGRTRPRLTGLEVEEEEEEHASGGRDEALQGGEQDDDELYDRAWDDGDFEDSPREHWFGHSPETRSRRPSAVTHPVGTVYKHTQTGARGVVVGWDPVPVAPRQWIDANVPLDSRDKAARLGIPHYAVLEQIEDKDGNLRFMNRYVVSECRRRLAPPTCLQPESPAGELQHPEIAKFFRGFSPTNGYLPNAELRDRYPEG